MERLPASKAEITQQDLRRAFTLASEIHRLQGELDRIHEDLYARRKAGAAVESGAHVCEIETYRKGKVCGERIIVR